MYPFGIGFSITSQKNMHAYCRRTIHTSLVRKYGKHLVSTDGGGTWYPSIHRPVNLRLKHHHIHPSFGKSIIERTIQYVKDRTVGFDDYFLCRKEKTSIDYNI
jgi:putative transposase